MMPHIYNILRGYPSRWLHYLDIGQNLTVTELLEWMDRAFGDVREYDTMIHFLYEIRQKDGESVEEYMVKIHEAVAVIRHTYLGWVVDQGKNWATDRFNHGLAPSLRDTLEFMLAELPEREQAGTSFDTLYMLAKKMEAHQPNCTHQGQGSFDLYQDGYWKHSCGEGDDAC